MMINPNNPLTLIEAAKLIGVSTQTVRRLIQREVLTAQQSLGPHGLRWEIERADLLRYLEETRPGLQPQQPLSSADVDHYQHPNNPNTEPQQNPSTELNNPYQPVDHGQQEPQQPLSSPQQPQHEQSVPLAAHLAALELARAQLDHLQRQAEEAQRMVLHAERAKISLESQLGQYQRVLSEQAESLSEERARRMALEAAKVQAEQMALPPLGLPKVEPKITSSNPGWGGRLRSWLGLGKKKTG